MTNNDREDTFEKHPTYCADADEVDVEEGLTPRSPTGNKVESSQISESIKDPNLVTSHENDFMYSINDIPPWYLCISFGLQHYLITIGSLVGIPLLLAPLMCIGDDVLGNIAKANLISSVFVVSGVCTLLQTTLGSRLPIMQGNSIAFLTSNLAMLSLPHNQCPSPLPSNFTNSSLIYYQDNDSAIVDGEELWHRRIREIQGAIIVASMVEVALGFTGAIGFLMRFIGPLTIMPTITLIGLDLFTAAASNANDQWGIAIFTTVMLVMCSQYLTNIKVPLPMFKDGRCQIEPVPIFKMFPVIIALGAAWILCAILTATNTIPNDPDHVYYRARTDVRADVIHNSAWLRIPYPGQWGLPKVTVSGFVGMLGAIIASIIESIGDYYACARLSQAPSPPQHAINRGIMMEGIGCMFAGLVGTVSGTTSISQNIAAIGITRVASRRVLQAAGLFFVVLGLVSKVGSVFVAMPNPVMGGVFFVMFGMITAVGLSNLRFVDMTSSRNIFISGFTLFMGLSVSNWIKQNPAAINTGVSELDRIFTVIFGSAMLVGGLLGMFLDNTIPGTVKERGICAWNNEKAKSVKGTQNTTEDCYNLPFPTRGCCRLPILPSHHLSSQQNENVLLNYEMDTIL